MGRILIININTDYWTDERIDLVRSGIEHHSSNQVFSTRYEKLKYSISNNRIAIYDTVNERDLAEFDAVYLRDIRDYEFDRHAVALYLKENKIPFFNRDAVNMEHISKLTQNMVFVINELQIPEVLYSPNNELLYSHVIENIERLKYPIVIKSISGRNGDINFLANNEKNLKDILTKHPDVRFMAQPFIPNSFDYRIIVLGGTIGSIATRTRDPSSEDHRNNVQLGAKKQYVNEKSVSQHILSIAKKAAKAVNREITGVDVIIDKTNNIPYLLEANYAYAMILDKNESQELPELARYFDEIIKKTSDG